jgi:hypothetical protein
LSLLPQNLRNNNHPSLLTFMESSLIDPEGREEASKKFIRQLRVDENI